MLEVRCRVEVEQRGDGAGRIRGTILPIGRVAGDRREVFAPGSVTWPSNGVRLLAEHRGRQVMRFTPIERAGDLQIDEQLPDTDLGREVAADIRSGKRGGLSVEFNSIREKLTQGVREITAAIVDAAAIVGAPAYDQARAEVRGRQHHRRVLTWL